MKLPSVSQLKKDLLLSVPQAEALIEFMKVMQRKQMTVEDAMLTASRALDAVRLTFNKNKL